MSTALAYLAWSALLCALLWVPYVLARFQVWGIADTVGYPENPKALPQWAQRAQRAHMNMVENLVPFAALVLIAHLTGKGGGLAATGAAIFFYARLAHAGVLIAGLPWARTGAFIAGWVGTLLVFLAVVR
ncbi:MAG: MAPEG family protein [Alphaproteobacteria bacterium]|nr:MAPEG family protein [Alphaproteobacteria bacterium]